MFNTAYTARTTDKNQSEINAVFSTTLSKVYSKAYQQILNFTLNFIFERMYSDVSDGILRVCYTPRGRFCKFPKVFVHRAFSSP